MLSGPRKPKNLAVFISGSGSTLQALLEFHHQLNISLIITNNTKAAGIAKAKRFGKKVLCIPKPINFKLIQKYLDEYRIDQIMLAGFMKIIPPEFVQHWSGRIFNIHPSLLPKFPGLNSAERSWESNHPMGVTLHHVIAEMDAGKNLLQKTSLESPSKFDLSEASLFLRRSEQHLLREMTLRYL